MAMLTEVERVPLGRIQPNPSNPRAEFDEGKLKKLADSFAANGGRPFTPLLVVRDGSRYMIVDGERRYRAMCLVGEVADADVVVAEDAEAAYAMAAMMATDSKERLTDVERAVGTQQMLMLGVEPDVVDKTAGFERGRARRVKALVEDRDEPVQITLSKLFRVADIDDALEREQLMDMVAGQTEEEANSWDSPFAKRLTEAEGRQRRAQAARELRGWLEEHGIACGDGEPDGMRCAERLCTWDLDRADPVDLAADGAVVTVDEDGYNPSICLWEPAEREETEEERAEREEREWLAAACREFVSMMKEAEVGRVEWLCGWLRSSKRRNGALSDILLDMVRGMSAFNRFAEEVGDLVLDARDLSCLVLPLIGVEQLDAAALCASGPYAHREVADGEQAAEVRGWLELLSAFTEEGYVPTGFEVRARVTLTGLLKAWDARADGDGGEAD